MAKGANQNRLSNGRGVIVEQNTVFDDYLLPPAEELSKLNQIDQNIITWIMKRAEMEFAFIILVLAMLFSLYLIKSEMSVEGSLFAGSTIVIAAVFFIKASKNREVK